MRLSLLPFLLVVDRAQSIEPVPARPRSRPRSGDRYRSKVFSIYGGQRSALDDEYDEPYIPPNEDDDSAPSSANIQFMITNRMRYILENDLGYLPEEVDEMEPQIVRRFSHQYTYDNECRLLSLFREV